MNMRFDPKLLWQRAALFIFVLHAWLLLSLNAQVTNNRASPDFRLTSGQTARNIPFELYMNLIFLQVRVNGSKTLYRSNVGQDFSRKSLCPSFTRPVIGRERRERLSQLA